MTRHVTSTSSITTALRRKNEYHAYIIIEFS